jgi:hypothetical protein
VTDKRRFPICVTNPGGEMRWTGLFCEDGESPEMALLARARAAGIECDSVSLEDCDVNGIEARVAFVFMRGEVRCEVPVSEVFLADRGYDFFAEAKPLIDIAISRTECEREIGHIPNRQEYRSFTERQAA